MALIDQFKDIIKHTASLGIIDMVKVLGTPAAAKIETKDVDNTVIIYGDMAQPIDDINSTIGLSRLTVLKGLMSMHEGSTVSMVIEQRNGADVPTEVTFDNNSGLVSSYRLMSESMINDQIKVPPFKGATWDVVITPSKLSIDSLGTNYGVLGGFEKRFVVVVDKGMLKFNIGTGPTDRTSVPFAVNVKGTLKHQWTYPLAQVLSILKLTDTSTTATMSFSDMGALKIDIDSGIGTYTYILPAGKS